MSEPLSATALALLNADFAVAGRWQMMGATKTTHVETDYGNPPTLTTKQHIVANMICAARNMTLVVMLEGVDGQTPTLATVNFEGTPFTTSDSTLIDRIYNAVPSLVALRDQELIDALQAVIS